MTDPARLRAGWPATVLDLLAAGVAMLLAYRLRFDGPRPRASWPSGRRPWPGSSPAAVTGAAAGLYRRGGPVMWPVRLAVGAIAGAALGVLAAALAGATAASRARRSPARRRSSG